MPTLNKSSILFVFLNFIRFLSIVAICLSFSGEVVTMVSDLRTVQAASHSPAPVPSTTASTKIFRRSLPDPIVTPFPSITYSPVLWRREPASLRDLDATISSPTATSSRRSTPTSSTRAITATNSPSPSSSTTTTPYRSCSYISSTSIPTQPGGSLFSTLSRICCCLILLASLASETCPPVSTKLGRVLERWWTYSFPPFGKEFGTGVLGGVQVFMGCTVLSHAVGKFTQVSGWFLFIVGTLNLLCGLAFGSRLKVIRSPFADSTSPSALRRLRLHSSPSAHSLHPTSANEEEEGTNQEEGGGFETTAERVRAGQEERRKWYRFENASAEETSVGFHPSTTTATLDTSEPCRSKVRFTPSAAFGGGGARGEGAPKRSASRNGPKGIIISGPMYLRGGGAIDHEENVYGEMEEIRNGSSSRASSRGGAIGLPPPVYSGGH